MYLSQLVSYTQKVYADRRTADEGEVIPLYRTYLIACYTKRKYIYHSLLPIYLAYEFCHLKLYLCQNIYILNCRKNVLNKRKTYFPYDGSVSCIFD